MKTRKELELAIAMGVATEDDFDGYSATDVFDIKASLPYAELVMPASVLKAPTDEQAASKTVTMIFNTQAPDRMGDLLMSNPKDAAKYGGKGWELDRFELAGGPYLHGHDHAFTIGRVLSPRVEQVKVMKEGGGTQKLWALVGEVRFLDNPALPFSQGDYLLTLEGLAASSVGYIPKVRTYIEDEEERAKLGLGMWGTVQSTMELLEISKVAVPANQYSAGAKAIDNLVSKGLMEASLASDYKRVRIEEPAARVHSKLRVMVEGTEMHLDCLDGVCTTCDTVDRETDEDMAAIDEATCELGVEHLCDMPDAIRALKAMSPNERALARLQEVFDRSSEMTEKLQNVLEELGDDGDLSRLALASGSLVSQNINVSALAGCLVELLAGSPQALTRLSALEVSGGPVVPSEGTSDGEPATGGDGSDASRVAETELALAQGIDDIVERL